MTTETIFFDKETKKVSLTAYIADSSREMATYDKRPAILIFPGGAYSFCSDREAEPIALAYMAEGYNAFVLRYSLKEDSLFPRPLHDAEQALMYIRENAERFHVYSDKVAVIGFSAGGHLAAALATMGSVRPDAALLAYPCILSSIGDVLYHPVPSLEKEVDEQTSPCFIFATFEDKTVPVKNSLAFADALDAHKIPFEMHIFTTGDHGLSLAKPHTANGNAAYVNERVAQWLPMSVTWLAEQFKLL